MSFDALSGVMDLDASGYISEGEDVIDVQDELADSSAGASDSLLEIDGAGIAAGAALAGIGTAAQGALDSTRDMRETLGRTSVSMGLTQDEAESLATSMSDATFPLEDVTQTMDRLAQNGVESQEEMQRLADASDNLADATGTTAEAVAGELGPAIQGLDGDLDGLEENADAFTLAVRNTNLETGDLANTMERSNEELTELGLQSEDAAGLIAAYGEETGKSGTRLRRDFNSALREADGDLEKVKDELGVGSDVLEEWSEQVEDAEGITDDYSESANESVSTMDRLRARFDDVRLQAAGMLGPVDAAAPALQALGVAAIGASTINMSALVPSFAAVSAAALPVTAAILGVGAAAAAAYAIWERDIGGIQDRADSAYETVTGAFGGLVEFVEDAFESLDYILTDWSPTDSLADASDAITGFGSSAKESITSNVTGAIDGASDRFRAWNPATILRQKRDEIRDAMPSISDGREVAERFLDGAWNMFVRWHPAGIIYDKRDEIRDAMPSVSDGREAAEALVGGFTDAITDGKDRVTDAVEGMVDSATSFLPSSDAEQGPLSNLSARGAAIPATLAENIRQNAGDVEEAVEDMAKDAVRGLSIRDVEEALAPELEELESQVGEPLEEALEGRRAEIDELEADREDASLSERVAISDEIDTLKNEADEIETLLAAFEEDVTELDDGDIAALEGLVDEDVATRADELLEIAQEVDDAETVADIRAEVLADTALDIQEEESRVEDHLQSVQDIIEEEALAETKIDVDQPVPAQIDGRITEGQDASEIKDTTDRTSTDTASQSGGISVDDIRQALEGLMLDLGGQLTIDGDVVSPDDLDARLQLETRKAQNRRLRR